MPQTALAITLSPVYHPLKRVAIVMLEEGRKGMVQDQSSSCVAQRASTEARRRPLGCVFEPSSKEPLQTSGCAGTQPRAAVPHREDAYLQRNDSPAQVVHKTPSRGGRTRP